MKYIPILIMLLIGACASPATMDADELLTYCIAEGNKFEGEDMVRAFRDCYGPCGVNFERCYDECPNNLMNSNKKDDYCSEGCYMEHISGKTYADCQ